MTLHVYFNDRWLDLHVYFNDIWLYMCISTTDDFTYVFQPQITLQVLSIHIWIYEFVIRLTQRVSLVEQELLTLPEHPSSPPVISGVRVTRSLVLCVFCRSLFVLLAIVLSLLRYTDSDYPFGIFKFFSKHRGLTACVVRPYMDLDVYTYHR
jgi:hypothetical protein